MQFIIFRIIVIPRIFSEKGRVGIGMSFTLKSKVFFFFFSSMYGIFVSIVRVH